MWALIRKNLWLWRPGLSGNWLVFGIALLFSIFDAVWRFPTPAWGLLLFFAVILGQAAASSSLSIDLKEDNVRFLEYLPVRWSHVWLANWLDGVLTCLLFIGLLTWHRVLFWSPPQSMWEHERFMNAMLFGTRWQFPTIVTSLMLGVFCYTIFWRTFFRSELAAAVPQVLAGLPFSVAPIAILAMLGVSPLLGDLSPLLLGVGLLFSVASLTCFALLPQHWSRIRRFWCVGLPLAFVILAMGNVGLLLACTRWVALEPDEPGLRYRVEVARATMPTSRPVALIHAHSSRSGDHLLCYDPAGHPTPRYLGRGFQSFGGTAPAVAGDRLLGRTRFAADGLWPLWGEELVSVPLDGSGPRTALGLKTLAAEDGRRFTVNGVTASADGSFLVAGGMEDSGNDGRMRSIAPGYPNCRLFVLDPIGRVRRSFAMRDPTSFAVGEGAGSGRVLLVLPQPKRSDAAEDPAPKPESEPESVRYCLYDVGTDKTSEFQLPGDALGISSDLKTAVCLLVATRDGMRHRSVAALDLPDVRQQRLLIPEDQLLPVADGSVGSDYSYGSALPVQKTFGDQEDYITMYGEPVLAFDRAFGQAVWLAQRIDQGARRLSLVYIDLATGERRLLVPESELPALSVVTDQSAYRAGLHLWGFTADGDAFVYQLEKKVHYVRPADGSRQTLELPKESYGLARFSPSRRRCLVSFLPEAKEGEDSRRRTEITQVLEVGHAWAVNATSDYGTVQWLDDDHLIGTEPGALWTVKADGTDRRQILPQPSP